MAIVAHDTELMREWIDKLQSNDEYYLDMIEELFGSVDTLVGSPEFSGGVPETFREAVVGKQPNFMRYDEVFKDLVELMQKKLDEIESDTQSMVNRIQGSSAF